jgi:hypothetical protein
LTALVGRESEVADLRALLLCQDVLSVPTVKRHLTTVFAKLGVSARVAATDVIRTQGLD